MKGRLTLAAVVGLATTMALPAVAIASAGAQGTPGTALGTFGPLFEEPSALAGDVNCGARGFNPSNNPPAPKNCKPAAMAIAVLSNGQELYWDGLEGFNQVSLNTVAQYGAVAPDDQSRVMTLGSGGAAWAVPTPDDGGRSSTSGAGDFLPGVPHVSDPNGSSDLFCSSLVQMPDGKVLAAGGTDYYLEPGTTSPAGPLGVSELEGLRVTRIFDPTTRTWSFSGNMNYGRWYPSLVTMPNGKVFVASGVTKLIKPAYPGASTYNNQLSDSGTNVRQTETYDPVKGQWIYNGTSADKSLPLFPRVHLLPDGKVYYDAGGQTFNPDGQSYDEALWNLSSVYDPATRTWSDLGVPSIGGLPLGFRGSAFSVMLPLRPDATGRYTKAQFLSAGGVIGVSPGTYVATSTSTLNTVDSAHGDAFTSQATGSFNNARWYSTGVVLPDGEVFAVNGASRDEVVGPGSGTPVTQAELYNPVTKQWHRAATETDGRTYHNTAVLLPDATVLVGGHAPIATAYAFQDDAGHDTLGLSKAESDPSFQVYRPPYLSWGIPQPQIRGVSATSLVNGSTLGIESPQAASITQAVLVRNSSLTHLVDGDQRTVQLPITGRSGSTVQAAVPGATVLPPGPYMLFLLQQTPKGLLPSVSRQVVVNGSPPA
jgi:hypothetical protein